MSERRAVIAIDIDLKGAGTADDLARALRILLARASWGHLNPEVTVIDPGEKAP